MVCAVLNIFTYGNSVLSAFSSGQNSKCKFVLRPCFDTYCYRELHTLQCVFANPLFNTICMVHFASNDILYIVDLPFCSLVYRLQTSLCVYVYMHACD